MIQRSTILAAVAVLLVVVALVAFLARLYLVAGVCMLVTSFVIYLRETRG